MLLSPQDPRRTLFLTVPALAGPMMLKKSTTNKSGFERVRKHGKKWQAWTVVDGKQKFLADHKEAEEAAKELWKVENANKPILRSPSPGHRYKAKRALPAHCTSPLPHHILTLSVSCVPRDVNANAYATLTARSGFRQRLSVRAG